MTASPDPKAIATVLECYLVVPDLTGSTWLVVRPNPFGPSMPVIIEGQADSQDQAKRIAAGLVAIEVAGLLLHRGEVMSADDSKWLATRLDGALRFAESHPAQITLAEDLERR